MQDANLKLRSDAEQLFNVIAQAAQRPSTKVRALNMARRCRGEFVFADPNPFDDFADHAFDFFNQGLRGIKR